MKLSNRLFVLDRADQLYRLPLTRYSAMLADPKAELIPKFAAQRIRAVDAIVELIDRRPAQVIRIVCFIIEFDKRGALKVASLMQQAAAAMEARFSPYARTQGNVLEAESRFVAKGGRWKPSAALERLLHGAALGRISAPRL